MSPGRAARLHHFLRMQFDPVGKGPRAAVRRCYRGGRFCSQPTQPGNTLEGYLNLAQEYSDKKDEGRLPCRGALGVLRLAVRLKRVTAMRTRLSDRFRHLSGRFARQKNIRQTLRAGQ